MHASARLHSDGAREIRARLLAAAVGCSVALLVPCAGAQAAPVSYFLAATSNQTGNGASTLVISKPAGVIEGDVMIATIDAETQNEGFGPPTGWSSTGLFEGLTNFGEAGIYYHVAGSSEPASYTWTLGKSRKATGRILAYTGVSSAAPIAKSATAGEASGTSDKAATVKTAKANSRVILDFGALKASGTFTITGPTGPKQRASVFTSGSGSVVGSESVEFLQAAAGETPGTYTFKPSASIPWGEATIALEPAAAGSLSFDPEPQMPALPAITLIGKAQLASATMNSFAVLDTTGSGSGWNITVAGDGGTGKSAKFKEYCSNGSEPCGSHAANSYVTGGQELPEGSLTLSTLGATWTSPEGASNPPTFQCTIACALDTSAGHKIVSAAAGKGEGPWTATFAAGSLSLSALSTLRALLAHEVYRVNLLWTLASGP
ncbi:MAG TPA: hypothetical protein VKG38_19865 [Solirubrobacteraceae bacterium]|nr:hypothetical protein [Solirubrobacteraceae bacterium]